MIKIVANIIFYTLFVNPLAFTKTMRGGLTKIAIYTKKIIFLLMIKN